MPGVGCRVSGVGCRGPGHLRRGCRVACCCEHEQHGLVGCLQELSKELAPIRATVAELKKHQVMVILTKFIAQLLGYLISGALLSLPFVKAVLHPFWRLVLVLAKAISTAGYDGSKGQGDGGKGDRGKDRDGSLHDVSLSAHNDDAVLPHMTSSQRPLYPLTRRRIGSSVVEEGTP
jgi:hypothetical protein